MPDLQKQLLLYNGYDQVPVNDYTTDTAWQQTEFGINATNGDGAESTWVVDVPLGDIPDKRGATGIKYISPHNRMKLFVGSNTIWRGRVAGQTFERGPTRGTYPQQFTVTNSDPNSELEGMIVHNWVRGAETDVARAQGLVASYLSANPRPSTVLNGSNYVITGSNTVAMAAKTYTAVTPAEILQEIARFADKDMFVDVDDNLHYHGHDYTGFDSPLRISDDLADLNANTLLPIEPKASEEALDQITVLRSYFGADEVQRSVQVTDNSHLLTTDYWEDLFYDEDSVTTAEATVAARQALAPRRLDQITYTVRVGMPGVIQDGNSTPMRGDFCYMLKAGMRIQFKSRAVRGGIANNGSRIGDVFQTCHIREVRWTFPGPDQYYADLTLERPIRPFRGKAQPAATTPKPAPEEIPQPGDTLTGLVAWSFDADALDDATSLIDSNLIYQATGLGDIWDDMFDGGYGRGANGGGDTDTVLCDATSKHFAMDYGFKFNPAIRDVTVTWYDDTSATITLGVDTLIDGSGHATNTEYHLSTTLTPPAGTESFEINWPGFAGAFFDNIVVSNVAAGTEVENDPDAVDYGDCPHESAHFLPSDYAMCRYEQLQDQINSGQFGWFNVKDYGALGDGTTNDQAAINLAIAALNTAGSGVLYFPAGEYLSSGALTAIDVPGLVMGDGNTASKVICSSATANLFTVTEHKLTFQDLWLDNSHATPSAGAAILVSAGNLARYERLTISDFWIGIDHQDGIGWVMNELYIESVRKYGIRIAHATPDFGDWAIDNSLISDAAARSADAAIRIESSGGGKITNLKVNGTAATGYNHGIDLNIATGIQTIILLVTNCSIENIRGDGIHGVTAGTGRWPLMVIAGNQFALNSNNAGKAISLVAASIGQFGDAVISNNLFATDGTARSAVQLTNVDNTTFVGNVLIDNFTSESTETTCTNITHLGAGVTDHGALTGLTDDDHTQYLKETDVAVKGDLYAASANDTVGVLTVGSNDQVLTADSTQALGVKWATPASGGIGPILIADDHSTPLVFADLLQTEEGDDLLYAEP